MQRFNVFLCCCRETWKNVRLILTRGWTFDLLITALDSLPLGSARLMGGGSLNYIGCWDDNKVVCHFILLGLKSCQNEHILPLMPRNAQKNKNGKTLPIINFDVFGQTWQFWQNLVKITKLCKGTDGYCGGTFGKTVLQVHCWWDNRELRQ